jgi:hypothetical protein
MIFVIDQFGVPNASPSHLDCLPKSHSSLSFEPTLDYHRLSSSS